MGALRALSRTRLDCACGAGGLWSGLFRIQAGFALVHRGLLGLLDLLDLLDLLGNPSCMNCTDRGCWMRSRVPLESEDRSAPVCPVLVNSFLAVFFNCSDRLPPPLLLPRACFFRSSSAQVR